MNKSFFPRGAAGGISGGVYQACPERSYFISLKLNGSPFTNSDVFAAASIPVEALIQLKI